MRYLTADYIFPISQPPIKNGVIDVDDDGRIVEVRSPKSEVGSFSDNIKYQTLDIQHFKGILCPGFVNTHCHLELSHMKGTIPEATGLVGFIKNFIAARKTFSAEQIKEGIEAGEQEMLKNGIVAVGDISNVADTFQQKAKGNLKYYTFIEAFDFLPHNAANEFERAKGVAAELEKIFPEAEYSIVPHAPYSVSEELFRSLTPGSSPKGEGSRVLSIHNQESADENLMFNEKGGKIIEFFTAMGMDFSQWKASGKNSLLAYLQHFSKDENVLLVHNTFSSKEDITFAESYSKNIYWATCPNANLYIEGRLPDYNLFMDANVKMTIGTDSLASNYSLSVLDELKTISKHFPQIRLETLLQWATLNGAQALGFQNELGSFEKGKKPGVLLIQNINKDKLCLTAESNITRLA